MDTDPDKTLSKEEMNLASEQARKVVLRYSKKQTRDAETNSVLPLVIGGAILGSLFTPIAGPIIGAILGGMVGANASGKSPDRKKPEEVGQ